MQLLTPKELERQIKSLPVNETARLVEDVALPEAAKWPLDSTRNVTFRRCRFPHLNLATGFWERIRFEHCCFDAVNMPGSIWGRVRAACCTFTSCVFDDDHGTYVHHSTFSHCNMVDIALGKTYIRRSKFHDCILRDLRAKRAMWEKSTLVDTVLSGDVENVSFIDNSYGNVNFSQAMLVGCGFVGAHRGLRLPSTEECFVVDGAGIRSVLGMCKHGISAEGVTKYEEFLWQRRGCRDDEIVEIVQGDWPLRSVDIRGDDFRILTRALYEVRRR